MTTGISKRRIGLFTGLAYFLLAGFAMAIDRHGGLSALSPATPFLLAMLIGRSRRQWGPIFIGAIIGSVIASSIFGFGIAFALPMTAARVGEVGVALLLFNRLRIRRGFPGSLERTGRFVAAVGVAGPATGATIAATTVAFGHGLSFDQQWRLWFVGHSLSMISMTPVLSLILSGAVRRWWRDAPYALRLEGLLLIGMTTMVAAAVFGQDRAPLLFLPILPVMLTTFRLGLIGAAAASIILALVGGYATLHDMGPANFLGGEMRTRMEFLQLYLASTMLTAFPVAADLSRRQALYRRLGESEARYRLLADHSTDIMMDIDAKGRIKYLSPSFEQITGRNPLDFNGRQVFELIHPLDRTAVMAAHHDAIGDPKGTQIVEYRAQMNDGAQRWFESHIRAVLGGDGMVGGTVSMIRDVSHRKSREAELSRAASTDPLTGLANRRVFDAALAERIAASGPDEGTGCVAVFDIDHFKAVNDRFGHDAGDKALQAFARMARGIMREGDIVARLGGEEFGILFPDTGIEQAHGLCERLRTTLAATRLRHGPSIVELTVSAGIAAIGRSDTAATVLRSADLALYAAKAEGRDRLRRAA